MVELVMQMLSLHQYLQKAKTDQERWLAQQEIEATDFYSLRTLRIADCVS